MQKRLSHCGRLLVHGNVISVVTDGWTVYPGFIPAADQIVSKTYMTRVENENTRLRHKKSPTTSQDVMLLQIQGNAETQGFDCYYTISNSRMSLFQTNSYPHSATPLLQVGTPLEYEQPVNLFVAQFIGRANFLDGVLLEVCDRTLKVLVGDRPFKGTLPAEISPGNTVRLVVRPENIILNTDSGSGCQATIIRSSVSRLRHQL